jgi:hypothetical protein
MTRDQDKGNRIHPRPLSRLLRARAAPCSENTFRSFVQIQAMLFNFKLNSTLKFRVQQQKVLPAEMDGGGCSSLQQCAANSISSFRSRSNQLLCKSYIQGSRLRLPLSSIRIQTMVSLLDTSFATVWSNKCLSVLWYTRPVKKHQIGPQTSKIGQKYLFYLRNVNSRAAFAHDYFDEVPHRQTLKTVSK